MSSKDRNTNIPLGTFGASQPPPPLDRAEPATPPTPAPPPERRSNKSTLVGHPAVPADSLAPSVAPEPASSVAPGARRSSVPNTLVGHPRPGEATAASQGPFLAPPKWQGASAYEGDAQPELQVGRGSRPSSPEEEVEPERAVSMAPAVEVSADSSSGEAATSDEPDDEAASDPNLDDSIQRMLDEQAAVKLEVDEAAARDVDLSAPSIELSASDIEVQSVLAAARAKAVVSSPPPTPAAAISSKPPRRPKGDEIADIPLSGGPDLAPASFAPAEVASEPPDDSNPGLGILFVAAMAVIGVGGWLLTQGTYQRPRAPVAAPAAAATAPVAPTPPVTTAPPTPKAEAAPAPAPVTPPANPPPAAPVAKPEKTKPAPAHTPAPRSARRPTPAPRQAPPPPRAVPSPAAAADEPVLKPVDAYPQATPSAAPKAPAIKPELLPDTPSRADVVAALDGVKAQVVACAPGHRGVAEVDLTVQSSGQVSHAVVRGDFAGTPEGSCIARAVRGAVFGPFKQPRFRVVYPFALQ